jgi:Tfp pilus assembly protein PilF
VACSFRQSSRFRINRSRTAGQSPEQNSSFADLHTLACLYAAQGKTTEARQLLLDSMAAGNQAEPNASVWFGFGSIYEQLGENDAAIAAYHRVTAPDGAINPIDTYNPAQASLKRLHSN